MKVIEYDRQKAVAYAKKWAYSRNPSYYNFDTIGGDCTNFISQCLFHAGNIMNYQANGWYYRNGNDKSPSWTGVEYLHQFLTKNTGVGPFGKEIEKEQLKIGDIIQLSFQGTTFQHSLLVVSKQGEELKDISVATHTFDSYGRKVATYSFEKIRYIQIEGIRKW